MRSLPIRPSRRVMRYSSVALLDPALLDNIEFGAADKFQHLGALGRRNLEGREGGLDMEEKRPPVAFADPHAAVRDLHVAPGVVKRPTGRGAQKVDQQLFLAAHAVEAAIFPEPAELLVGH